jgi:hypothetical protein
LRASDESRDGGNELLRELRPICRSSSSTRAINSSILAACAAITAATASGPLRYTRSISSRRTNARFPATSRHPSNQPDDPLNGYCSTASHFDECQQTTTDGQGRYTLAFPRGGSFIMQVSAIGSSNGASATDVNVAAGGEVEEDFTLDPASPLAGGFSITTGGSMYTSGVPSIYWGDDFTASVPIDIPQTAPPNAVLPLIDDIGLEDSGGGGVVDSSRLLFFARYDASGQLQRLSNVVIVGKPTLGATAHGANARRAHAAAAHNVTHFRDSSSFGGESRGVAASGAVVSAVPALPALIAR